MFLFICSSFFEEHLQHFVESMATRTNVVLKAKGDPTWYQQGGPNKVFGKCTFTWCKHASSSLTSLARLV